MRRCGMIAYETILHRRPNDITIWKYGNHTLSAVYKNSKKKYSTAWWSRNDNSNEKNNGFIYLQIKKEQQL